jgi:CarD family transcriptional regulator
MLVDLNECAFLTRILPVTEIEEEAMKFTAGDAIVHPTRGAGIVERIVERTWHGNAELYYRIRLLGQSGTMLMIPASAAEKLGLRGAISQSNMEQLWRVLLAAPMSLPSKHRDRAQLLQDKLGTGDVFQVAEMVRDIAWRQWKTRLGITAKRLYEEGIRLLAGEIAATQDIEFADAETQLRARLRERLSSATVM